MTVQKDGTVLVRAPLKRSNKVIDRFVTKNAGWIDRQKKKHREMARQGSPLSEEEIRNLKNRAKIVLTRKSRYYATLMGVEYTGIKITSAKGRWGSCSGKNSICYSYRVMLLDDDLQDYIVVHELSHIKQKNHSALFYKEIENILPNYKERQRKIKNFSNFDLY